MWLTFNLLLNLKILTDTGSASCEDNNSILSGPYSTVYPYSSGQYNAQL